MNKPCTLSCSSQDECSSPQGLSWWHSTGLAPIYQYFSCTGAPKPDTVLQMRSTYKQRDRELVLVPDSFPRIQLNQQDLRGRRLKSRLSPSKDFPPAFSPTPHFSNQRSIRSICCTHSTGLSVGRAGCLLLHLRQGVGAEAEHLAQSQAIIPALRRAVPRGAWSILLSTEKIIVENLMAGPKNAFLHHKDWPQLSFHNYTLQIKNSKQPEQKLNMVANQNPLSE